MRRDRDMKQEGTSKTIVGKYMTLESVTKRL
jgi:hypothetical protein